MYVVILCTRLSRPNTRLLRLHADTLATITYLSCLVFTPFVHLKNKIQKMSVNIEVFWEMNKNKCCYSEENQSSLKYDTVAPLQAFPIHLSSLSQRSNFNCRALGEAWETYGKTKVVFLTIQYHTFCHRTPIITLCLQNKSLKKA